MSAQGSKIGLIKRCASGTMVGLEGGDTDVAALVQENMMCDGK